MIETREKISIMYLFSFKSNAPELVESYWQRNGGKEAYEEARKHGKKKAKQQRTSSPKPSAPVTKRSTTPSQQQPTVVEIFTSSSSSSRSSSNNVTPEIPTSKRSLSPPPPSTKDKHNKRIRHDEDEDEDNQAPSLSSPVKEPRAVEKESPEPIMEATEDTSQQPVDLADEEPQQSPVVAIPEEEPEPSNDEVIHEEEAQRSPVKETPEEEPQRSPVKETPEEEPQQPINPPSPEGSQQTVVVEDTSKEPEDDMMVNADEDELMEEAPTRERSASRQLSPDQHMTTSDTDMVDELSMTDEEVDKPTTTSTTTTTTTKPTEDASSSSSPSKLSQSDIRAFVKENRLTSRTTDDSASQLDKLTDNKENIAVVSDTTMHDNEEHLMPGTPKDKQLKEIDVNDIIWDPEYPPAPCDWSEEAECVETVVADPNDKNTFHAIVRW